MLPWENLKHSRRALHFAGLKRFRWMPILVKGLLDLGHAYNASLATAPQLWHHGSLKPLALI